MWLNKMRVLLLRFHRVSCIFFVGSKSFKMKIDFVRVDMYLPEESFRFLSSANSCGTACTKGPRITHNIQSQFLRFAWNMDFVIMFLKSHSVQDTNS